MRVVLLVEAQAELRALPAAEQAALGRAADKLALLGEALGYPHTSAIKGQAEPLRELRPRAGRSAWRAFYRRVGSCLVIAAIGSEAQADRRGFERAVRIALERSAADGLAEELES